MTAVAYEPFAETARLPLRITLASPERAHGDGIGYVGTLLERALRGIAVEAPRVVEVGRGAQRVSLAARAHFAAAVAALQATARTDIVLYNHVGLARTQRMLPARARTPHAVFVHGIEVWDDALDAPRLDALRSASLRLANSSYTARRLHARHPELGPIAICPLALLDAAPAGGDVDRELLARVGSESVLILGRMSASERYKGHDELLEAWPAVRQAVPQAQLVIAGGGDDAPRLRAKAHALGLDDAVVFCGRVSEGTKQALLERVTAFAMPSRGEGFGLVYLEAMAASLPCIGSSADAAGDVIVHGETGLLVDPRDARDLAAAVSGLLGNAPLARRMGAAGRQRYTSEFTFARFQERLRGALVDTFGQEGVR